MSATSLTQLLAAHGAAWALGSLLKGTLLLLGVFLLAASLRRASAGLRHLVWSGGIAAVVLLPLVSLVLPWQLSVIRVPAPATAPPGGVVAAPGAGPLALSGTGTGAPGASQALPPAPWGSVIERRWVPSQASVARWVLWVWVAGVLVVLGRLLRGALLVRRVRRRATSLAAPEWTRPLIEAADRLGLAREPQLLASDAVLMPIVCGVFEPAIVLPAEAGTWSERRRRAVLCHELAHVRRFDLGLTILSRIGCAIYWFHPLVWVAARRLRLESERACDDIVLGVGTRPSEYADHLLQIACGAGSMHAPAAALPMAERREFEGRMLAILEKDASRAPASRRHAALLGGLGLAVLLPLAALGMARAPQADASRHPQPAGRAAQDAAAYRHVTTSATRRREATAVATHTETAVSKVHAVAALRDSAPGIRAAAARALGQADDTAAVAALARLLRGDASEDVRVAAAQALGRMEARSATPALGAALGDRSAVVRRTAAWALGQIEDTSAVPALARALSDTDPNVRETATWALGQIEAAAAVPALAARLARDDRVDVRRRAAWALGQIEDKAAVPALAAALRGDPDPEVRRTAAWALGQIEDAASVSALAGGLADTVAEVRQVSAWALGQVSPRHAPEALLRAVGHDVPVVREKAAWALGQIGDAAAVPALAAALADSVGAVRQTAMWALGQLDGAAARAALIGALKAPDPDVRAAAARALGGGHAEPRPQPMPMPAPRPMPDQGK
jgi:HEAT repeat protein/beta-lactamase regulating signal transducer with metallopeptidase domain